MRIDDYVLDVLMRDLAGHDKRPSAFIVYLYLWSRIIGRNARSARLSYQELADGTGLSKSAVQSAIALLIRRGLVRAHRASRTARPAYWPNRPWAKDQQR